MYSHWEGWNPQWVVMPLKEEEELWYVNTVYSNLSIINFKYIRYIFFREENLFNSPLFYYKNNICLYKMLHVLSQKGHYQALINKKEGSEVSWSCRSGERGIFYTTLL
jgi:hypothetical protein